jgi:hypothetical protein
MNLNFFEWKIGRQLSGYSKMLLMTVKFPLPFDIYLLKFTEGSFIKEHVDEVNEGYKHFRLNIILKKSKIGGIFSAEKSIFENSRIKFFRPDIYKHSVSKVESGYRIVLSIGFLIKK